MNNVRIEPPSIQDFPLLSSEWYSLGIDDRWRRGDVMYLFYDNIVINQFEVYAGRNYDLDTLSYLSEDQKKEM